MQNWTEVAAVVISVVSLVISITSAFVINRDQKDLAYRLAFADSLTGLFDQTAERLRLAREALSELRLVQAKVETTPSLAEFGGSLPFINSVHSLMTKLSTATVELLALNSLVLPRAALIHPECVDNVDEVSNVIEALQKSTSKLTIPDELVLQLATKADGDLSELHANWRAQIMDAEGKLDAVENRIDGEFVDMAKRAAVSNFKKRFGSRYVSKGP